MTPMEKTARLALIAQRAELMRRCNACNYTFIRQGDKYQVYCSDMCAFDAKVHGGTKSASVAKGIGWDLSIADFVAVRRKPCADCWAPAPSAVTRKGSVGSFVAGNVRPLCDDCRNAPARY